MNVPALRSAACALFVALSTTGAWAAGFALHSPSVADGAALASSYAAGGDCGGRNVSPALAWTNAPAGTASFALTMWDQDGIEGQGVSHWIAYGIPAAVTAIPEGFGSAPSGAFVGGTNTRKTLIYFGPCPPPGDTPHHYVITVYALDLAPGALPAGLTRDAFYPAIKGHTLGATSTVATYGR